MLLLVRSPLDSISGDIYPAHRGTTEWCTMLSPISGSKLNKGLQKEHPCHSLELQTALKSLMLQFNSWRIFFFFFKIMFLSACKFSCFDSVSYCGINTHSWFRLLHLLHQQPDREVLLDFIFQNCSSFIWSNRTNLLPLILCPWVFHVLISHILHAVGTKSRCSYVPSSIPIPHSWLSTSQR